MFVCVCVSRSTDGNLSKVDIIGHVLFFFGSLKGNSSIFQTWSACSYICVCKSFLLTKDFLELVQQIASVDSCNMAAMVAT